MHNRLKSTRNVKPNWPNCVVILRKLNFRAKLLSLPPARSNKTLSTNCQTRSISCRRQSKSKTTPIIEWWHAKTFSYTMLSVCLICLLEYRTEKEKSQLKAEAEDLRSQLDGVAKAKVSCYLSCHNVLELSFNVSQSIGGGDSFHKYLLCPSLG